MTVVETTPGCLGTPRIVFALEELNTPYQLQMKTEGHFLSEYGVVGPALVEGDFRLYEANPILRHLGRSRGMGTVMPSDLEGQARVDGWLDFLVLRIGMSFVRGLPEQAIGFLKVVERHLASNEWICGSFTVADCGFITMAGVSSGLPLDQMPHLRTYLQRLVSRAAWQRAQERLAEIGVS